MPAYTTPIHDLEARAPRPLTTDDIADQARTINLSPSSASDIASYWEPDGVSADDFLMLDPGESQPPLAIVCNPVAPPHVSSIRSRATLPSAALAMRFGLAINQRSRMQCAMWGLGSVPQSPQALPSVAIASLSQSSTTLTIVLQAPAPGYWLLGTPLDIVGVTDNRLAYQLLQLQSLSDDRLTIVATYAEGSVIQSLTASLGAGGYIRPSWDVLLGAANGAAVVALGATSTSGVLIQRSGGKNRLSSGLSGLAADPRVTVANTARSLSAGGVAYSHAPASEYLIELDEGQTCFMDRGADGGASLSLRGSIESRGWPVIPSDMRTFVALGEGAGMTRPLASIVSIVRATNVVTITLDRDAAAAGFAVGQYPQVMGVRDQTSFTNITFASNAISAVSGNTFTITWNGTDATSRGGSVALPCGGLSQPGLVAQAAQTITLNADGTLTLIGSAVWSGPVASDVVWLAGVRDATTGADLGADGPWVAQSMSGTTMTLAPITNALTGAARRSPVPGALSAVSCGGAVIIATVARLYSLAVERRGSALVRISGQGTASPAHAMPVQVVGGALSSVSSNQGSAAAAPGWPVTQGSTLATDTASGTITTTATTTAVAMVGTSGGASSFGLIFQVSAASGTLDLGIEATDDGTNYVRIWDMDRITATGTYRSPVFVGLWRSYRVVQTVSGSFTRAIVRASVPFYPGDPRRRIIDRTAALFSTVSTASTVLDCGNTRDVVVTVWTPATATTAPSFSIQAIAADGSTYYEIGTLSGVVGKAVKVKLDGELPGRMRIVCTTAGTGTLTGAYAVLMGLGF